MFCHFLPFFAIEKKGPPFTILPPPDLDTICELLNLKLATTKIWWTDLPNLMSGLPTPRDGGLHRRSWLASRGFSFPFLTCTLTTFLRLWLLVTQKGMTFGCAFWRLMSTWQCGVMSMVAFGVANSSFARICFTWPAKVHMPDLSL